MRTLSSTLKAAQQAASIDALVKIYLESGATNYTYTKTRILDTEQKESGCLQSCEIILDNADGEFTAKDLRGFEADVSFGAVASGDEYSACAPMWVTAQRFDSLQGKLICTLSLKGLCDLMADDKASATYQPDTANTDTVKDIINAIAGATLACFDHCSAITVDWDSEDSLIDSYQPKDAFRVYTGNNRLSAIQRLLEYTKCVMRAGNDGHLHIFVPTTTGVSYDYEYALTTGHTFFAKALRNRLTIPNYIVVQSRDDDDPQYSGYASEAESYGKLPKREYYQTRLTSNAQATSIAEAKLAQAQLWCESGSARVPMNVGAEVYDYVKVTDERESDSRVGNIGTITRKYTAGQNVWNLTFSFGNWLNVRKVLEDWGVTSDDLENYFSRLQVGDLYVENILADNMDFVWIDPDNTIDLSKIGDNLDNLPDGETYVRTRSMHLDASGVYLEEDLLYTVRLPGQAVQNLTKSSTAPTSPSTNDYWIDTSGASDIVKQWNGASWDTLTVSELAELNRGEIIRELKQTALTADGLVVLDEVSIGDEYGLIYKTYIGAGQLYLAGGVIEDVDHRLTSDGEKANWDGKAKVFRQATEPSSGMSLGDLWIDTDNGDAPYTYNGTAWIPAYTIIDGGYLKTGTVEASALTFSPFVLSVNDMDDIDEGDDYGKVSIYAISTGGQIDLSKSGVINKLATYISETSSRKWAGETGADVTGNHTADNTDNVGSKTASQVADGIGRAIAGLTSSGYVDKTVPGDMIVLDGDVVCTSNFVVQGSIGAGDSLYVYGEISAGGGDVLLSSAGVTVTGGKLTLKSSSGTYSGTLYVDTSGRLVCSTWDIIHKNIRPVGSTYWLGDTSYVYTALAVNGTLQYSSLGSDVEIELTNIANGSVLCSHIGKASNTAKDTWDGNDYSWRVNSSGEVYVKNRTGAARASRWLITNNY